MNYEKKKIAFVGITTLGAAMMLCGSFLLGIEYGWNEVGKTLIDMHENDGPGMLLESKNTHLIYDVKLECIGD